MSNSFYTASGAPSTGANLASAAVRTEFAAVQAAFDLLPILSGNGSNFVSINSGATAMTTLTPSAAKTALGLEIGANVQAWDADLDAIAALSSAADKVPYSTGAQAWALASFTAYGRSLVAAADAAAARAILTPFPSGTVVVFGQTSAPTGWTKGTTHNDKALRVVTGTAGSGGATAFTSVFGSAKSSGSYTLQVADIPSHNHGGATGAMNSNQSHTHTLSGAGNVASGASIASTPNNAGAFGSTDGTNIDHTHSISSQGGDGGHSHTLSLDLQYVDVILASKD